MVEKVRLQEGQTFGKWTVLGEGESTSRGRNWICQCECGTVREVLGVRLRAGKSTSCGCNNTEAVIKVLWKGTGEIGHNLWTSIMRSANSRNLDFSITIEYAWELFLKQNRLCAITNLPLTMYEHTTKWREYKGARGGVRGQRKHGTASLDRIDSSLGYIEGNVQWVHKDINRMKSDYTTEYFTYLCTLVVANRRDLGDNVPID